MRQRIRLFESSLPEQHSAGVHLGSALPCRRCPTPHCTVGVVSGDLSPRSSLAAAAIDGCVVVFGGATDRGERSDELALLSVAHNKLQWRLCRRTGGVHWPRPRGAHTAEVVGGRVYCAGGYGMVSGCGVFAWACDLPSSLQFHVARSSQLHSAPAAAVMHSPTALADCFC